MKWLWLLLALVLGAIAGSVWLSDPGYLLIRVNTWVLETSAAVALLLLLSTAVVLVIGWQFLARLLNSTHRLADWQNNKTLKSQIVRQQQGLVAIMTRDWEAGAIDTPSQIEVDKSTEIDADLDGAHRRFVQLVIAAHAAHARGDSSGRDKTVAAIEQLDQGSMKSPENSQMLFAQWYLEAAEPERAVAALRQLGNNKKHPRWLSLLLSAHVALQDWAPAERAWADLKKLKRPVVTGLRLHAYDFQRREAFNNPVSADTTTLARLLARTASVANEYTALTPAAQKDPHLISAWAHTLVSQGCRREALDLLEVALDNAWVEEWITLWFELADERLEESLRRAQQWADERTQDVRLQQGLGLLASKGKQWNNARGYFEAALKRLDGESPQRVRIYQQLGGVWHALGDEHRALQYFVQAEGLTSH